MLQWKKLQYYAKQNGIEDYREIRLNDEDCEYICSSVGIKSVPSSSIGGRFDYLISHIMDDSGYIGAHRSPGVSEDLLLIRCGDYAAIDAFKAYATKNNLKTCNQDRVVK